MGFIRYGFGVQAPGADSNNKLQHSVDGVETESENCASRAINRKFEYDIEATRIVQPVFLKESELLQISVHL